MIRWFGFCILAVGWICSGAASAQERSATGSVQLRQISPAAWEALQRGLPQVLAADPDDRYWDPQFGSNVADTLSVQAIVVKGDSIIIGGYFRTVAGIVVNSLALWDGLRWTPVVPGGALSPVGMPGLITALALSPEGNLIIAGQFSSLGGVTVTNLALYDWNTVTALPATFTGGIAAMTYYRGDLIIGGAFESINGIAGTRGIARWDGTSWHSLGGGVEIGNVSVLYVRGSELYVGGSFQRVGGVDAPALAVWDGSSWHALGDPFRGETANITPQVLAIAALPSGELVVGGDFYRIGSQVIPYLARWDGSSWNVLGPPDGPITALAVHEGKLFISGGFETVGTLTSPYAAYWDGSAWYSMANDMLNTSLAVLTPTDVGVLVGGNFTVALDNGFIANGLAVWTERGWAGFGGNRGNGLNGTVTGLVSDRSGAVYATGSFTRAGATPSPHLARFTGTKWEAVGGITFNEQQQLFYLLSPYRNETLALAAVIIADGQNTPAVLSYDPSTARATILGRIGGTITQRSVYALSYDRERDLLYCGGNYRTMNGDTVRGIAVYDGQQWRGLGGGIQSGAINAIAPLPDGSVIAGGTFSTIGGTAARSIARWNGSAWEPLGDGIGQGAQQGVVYALLVADGWLYVAGRFDRAGSVQCTNIARWNLTSGTWEAIPGGTNGTIYALCLWGDEIVAAGEFTRAGDTSANRIARYNPATGMWSRFGSGIEGTGATVRALAVAGGALCVGGAFDYAGGRSSRSFARWFGGTSSVEREALPAVASSAIELYPLPLGERCTARVQLRRGGNVRLDAYTLDGRHVGRLWEGWLSAGVHEFPLWLGGLHSNALVIVALQDGRFVGSAIGMP
jgi:hypothetical protein